MCLDTAPWIQIHIKNNSCPMLSRSSQSGLFRTFIQKNTIIWMSKVEAQERCFSGVEREGSVYDHYIKSNMLFSVPWYTSHLVPKGKTYVQYNARFTTKRFCPPLKLFCGPPDPDKLLNRRKLQVTFCLHWEGSWEVKYIFTSHDPEKTIKQGVT